MLPLRMLRHIEISCSLLFKPRDLGRFKNVAIELVVKPFSIKKKRKKESHSASTSDDELC